MTSHFGVRILPKVQSQKHGCGNARGKMHKGVPEPGSVEEPFVDDSLWNFIIYAKKGLPLFLNPPDGPFEVEVVIEMVMRLCGGGCYVAIVALTALACVDNAGRSDRRSFLGSVNLIAGRLGQLRTGQCARIANRAWSGRH